MVKPWGTFQLAGVKVSDATDGEPSAGFDVLTAMTTFAVGCEVRTTVAVATLPDSEVTNPNVGVTRIPLVSNLCPKRPLPSPGPLPLQTVTMLPLEFVAIDGYS